MPKIKHPKQAERILHVKEDSGSCHETSIRIDRIDYIGRMEKGAPTRPTFDKNCFSFAIVTGKTHIVITNTSEQGAGLERIRIVEDWEAYLNEA
jgi:hypothetical protein